ncbi:predicted protein [Arabidopsis lyrata subsp. lyrata]|uniref:Predicted protein n=1 Tax=Arabidopsis lyrata subsp. lyrata TaxID=81972 RepID=D7KS86_ARALL|nr:predicted protein [Arabidopsis lyrata subsp. lyrata]
MKYYGLEYDLGDPCLFAQGLAEFQTVPYFHAKYKVEEIPAHYIDRWQNKDIGDPSLSLPPLNEFMPSLFFEEIKLISLRDEDDVNGDTRFDICLNEVSSKLFHREDRSALLSNASFNLYTNVSDIKAHMRALIIIEMIKEDLSAILFKGEDVYINTSLAFGDNNIVELRFEGFKEKFKILFQKFGRELNLLFPRKNSLRYNIMDKMQREFTSWDIVQQASTLLSNVLIEGNITLDNKFKVLQSITFEDVKHFNFLSEVVGVCSGNISSEELKEIISIFEATGEFKIPYELGKKIVLTPGTPLQINVKPKIEFETNSLA